MTEPQWQGVGSLTGPGSVEAEQEGGRAAWGMVRAVIARDQAAFDREAAGSCVPQGSAASFLIAHLVVEMAGELIRAHGCADPEADDITLADEAAALAWFDRERGRLLRPPTAGPGGRIW